MNNMKKDTREKGKEEDLYKPVEEYFKEKLEKIFLREIFNKKLGDDKTGSKPRLNIYSGNASSGDLSLPLFGSYIKPDVYAVCEDEESGIFRVMMGEGKLTYKGRDLDGVIWQGISDQRYSHFVYVFFPKKEFEGKTGLEVMELLKEECERYGLGLLVVDTEQNKCEEVLSPRLSPFSTDENYMINFERNTLLARNKIRIINFGFGKEIERVHLTTLRDLSILLSKRECWTVEELFGNTGIIEELFEVYRRKEKSGEESSLRGYDPKVRKSIIEKGDKHKFKEIMKRNLETLRYFDIISCNREGQIEIKPLCKLMASLDKVNEYRSTLGENIQKFLAYLLLTNDKTRDLLEAIVKILNQHPNIPVWARKGDCPNYKKCKEKCGFRGNWYQEGQPFPESLKYDENTKEHICETNPSKVIKFNKCSVSSILHSLYNFDLSERLKILISESGLVKVEGKNGERKKGREPHRWALSEWVQEVK